MFRKSQFVSVLAIILALAVPGTTMADTVAVPFGTRVFIELDQLVTSKKKKNRPGSFVHAHVWRDVVVDGKTIVKAGTPAMVQVGDIKGAKVAGVKGHVELKAMHVNAVDGSDLMLTGGYDQSGKSLTALSVTLAVVVFVPLIFLKGKQAKLQPGLVFDAMVSQPTHIDLDDAPIRIRMANRSPLKVTVPLDQLEKETNGKQEVKNLPLRIRYEGETITGPRIVKVNDVAIQPIPITVGFKVTESDGSVTAEGSVNLKELGKHFTKGFNRFTVDVAGQTDDVVLDLEL